LALFKTTLLNGMNFDPNEEHLIILSADFKMVFILRKKYLQVSILRISKQSKAAIFSLIYVHMQIC